MKSTLRFEQNIKGQPGLPGVAREDSNEVIKIFGLNHRFQHTLPITVLPMGEYISIIM